MTVDSSGPVVALCAAGMQIEGTPDEARRLFEQVWAARRDDYDACIAAHFLARHQPTPAATLRWNAFAVQQGLPPTPLDARTEVPPSPESAS